LGRWRGRSTLAAVVCVQRWWSTMKETKPRDATTEMTIIRADKIAFDERQPAALHPTQTSLVDAHRPSRHSLPSLTHTPTLTTPRENRSDRKRSRTGNSTRVIRDGRMDVTPAARPRGRSGRSARRVSGVCSVERQQIDGPTCALMANASVALSEH